MTEHLRDRLHDEMSGHLPPPADNLVASAVADGLRTRKVRRTASGLGTVAVVGLTVLAVTFGSQLGAGPASTSAAGQAGSGAAPVVAKVAKVAPKPVAKPAVVKPKAVVEPTVALPSAGTVADKAAQAKAVHALQQAASAAQPPQWTAAPSGVPATPQGELQLFSELAAPYGHVSDLAVSEDADKTHVRARLTADGKTGGIQFQLLHDTLGYAGDCAPGLPNSVTCYPTSDGGYVINADDHAGCADNSADITVVHPDGTAVWITLASCPVDSANNSTPGAQTLSRAEVATIFQDPGFDFTMPADLVDRGQQNIGNLATFW